MGEMVVSLVCASLITWWILGKMSYRNLLHVEIDSLLSEDRGDENPHVALHKVQIRIFFNRRTFSWVVGALIAVALRSIASTPSIVEIFVFAGIGILASELLHSRIAEYRKQHEKRQMEFHLPLAMERIVMAVSAGLDIVPAIIEASRDCSDPISKCFKRVNELSSQGISVADALESMSAEVDVAAVKHAFVHLSLAHKEGGELIKPLRELSDATQLAYQERIEEEIAKLPVKAVLPLVFTFTGLIICFLTVPLIQVSSITQKVSEGALQ